MKNKLFGFTLSEVLVTLGIIGVVSAMTVPTLMRNHQRQVYVTQLKKIYSTLSQAFESAKNDRNATTLRETKLFIGADYANPFFKTYLKTTKICDKAQGCMADSYKTIDGDSYSFENGHLTCTVLVDGASFCMKGVVNSFKINKPANTYIDINGQEGPNLLGRDLFVVAVTNDGNIEFSDLDEGEYFKDIVEAGWQMNY